MPANDKPTSQKQGITISEQEKIHEFIRELALILRRITGRTIGNDLENLPADLGIIDQLPSDNADDANPK